MGAYNTHHSGKKKRTTWLTPLPLIEKVGSFDLDPATPIHMPWLTAKRRYTIIDNGLKCRWFGRVWLNPPYTGITAWMKRMALHDNGIALTFARTDTVWFQQWVFEHATSVLYMRKRIVFCDAFGVPAKWNGGAPSVMIAYGEQNAEAIEESGIEGKHVPINYTPCIVVGVSPSWFSVVSIAVRHFGDSDLKPVYDMVERMAEEKVMGNYNWKAKVRQQVQRIRKNGTFNISQTLT
jgi:hypothetical protein